MKATFVSLVLFVAALPCLADRIQVTLESELGETVVITYDPGAVTSAEALCSPPDLAGGCQAQRYHGAITSVQVYFPGVEFFFYESELANPVNVDENWMEVVNGGPGDSSDYVELNLRAIGRWRMPLPSGATAVSGAWGVVRLRLEAPPADWLDSPAFLLSPSEYLPLSGYLATEATVEKFGYQGFARMGDVVSLSVIPEPGSAGLVTLAGVALIVRANRHDIR